MSAKADLYQVLGVARTADEETIRKQYKRLALRWHPDRNKAANASAKFQEISRAYDILGDAEKKKIYDKYGEEGVKLAQAGHDPSAYAYSATDDSGSGSGSASAGSASDDDGDYQFSSQDADDLFRRFFGPSRGMNMGMSGMGMGMGGMNMGMGMGGMGMNMGGMGMGMGMDTDMGMGPGRRGADNNNGFFSFTGMGGGRPKMRRADLFDDDMFVFGVGNNNNNNNNGGSTFFQQRSTPFGFQQQSASSSSSSSSTPFAGLFSSQSQAQSSTPQQQQQQQQQHPQSSRVSSAGSSQASSQSSSTEPPVVVTHKLPCTLEDLAHGFSKNFKISRRVQDPRTGVISTASNMLTINGQPGWRAGTRVTFSNAGDQVIGAPTQDIVFVVEEMEHPRFKRVGDDLETTIHIGLADALCGTTVNIKSLDGRMIPLEVRSANPDTTCIIADEGMPKKQQAGAAAGAAAGRGNLVVKFKVEFPELNEVQKDAMRQVLGVGGVGGLGESA